MKKIVTTLLLSILSVVCIFAFAACGDDNNDDNKGNNSNQEEQQPQVVYTVTESEFKAAAKLITDGKTSIKYVLSMEGEKPMFCEHDTVNEALYYFMLDSGVNEYYRYFWVDGETVYEAYSDDDEKTVYEPEEYEAELEGIIEVYATFVIACDFENNYNKFTYDEAKKVYTAEIDFTENEHFSMPADKGNYTLSFENGKLIKCVVEMEDFPAYTMDYTYGITVTVPDSIKNLPVED